MTDRLRRSIGHRHRSSRRAGEDGRALRSRRAPTVSNHSYTYPTVRPRCFRVLQVRVRRIRRLRYFTRKHRTAFMDSRVEQSAQSGPYTRAMNHGTSANTRQKQQATTKAREVRSLPCNRLPTVFPTCRTSHEACQSHRVPESTL